MSTCVSAIRIEMAAYIGVQPLWIEDIASICAVESEDWHIHEKCRQQRNTNQNALLSGYDGSRGPTRKHPLFGPRLLLSVIHPGHTFALWI